MEIHPTIINILFICFIHFYYTIVIRIFAGLWSVICGLYELNLSVYLEKVFSMLSYFRHELRIFQHFDRLLIVFSSKYCIWFDIHKLITQLA